MIERPHVVGQARMSPEFLTLRMEVIKNDHLLPLAVERVKKARRSLVARGDRGAFGEPTRVYAGGPVDELPQRFEIELRFRRSRQTLHIAVGMPRIASAIPYRGSNFTLWNVPSALPGIVAQDLLDLYG
jgi:hypothetical protein